MKTCEVCEFEEARVFIRFPVDNREEVMQVCEGCRDAIMPRPSVHRQVYPGMAGKIYVTVLWTLVVLGVLSAVLAISI